MSVLLVGLYDPDAGTGDGWMAASPLAAGLATVAVWRAGNVPRAGELREARGRLVEFGADGLLWISVSIVTRFFWETWYQVVEPARGSGLEI